VKCALPDAYFALCLCERAFSKLNQIKELPQEILNGLAMLSIEHNFSKTA